MEKDTERRGEGERGKERHRRESERRIERERN